MKNIFLFIIIIGAYYISDASSVTLVNATIYNGSFLPQNASSGIVFDAKANSGFFSAASSTFNITVGTLTNGIIVVGCGADVPTSIKAVNYNGVAMTQQKLISTNEWSFIYTLVAPASGNHSVVVTWGSAVDSFCGAASFSGVNQTTPIDASASFDLSSTNPGSTVTVVTNGAFLVDNIFENGTSITAPATTNNAVYNLFNAGGPAGGAMSYAGPFAPGAQALSWSVATSADWAKVIIALKPA